MTIGEYSDKPQPCPDLRTSGEVLDEHEARIRHLERLEHKRQNQLPWDEIRRLARGGVRTSDMTIVNEWLAANAPKESDE